ncbi:MAG: class I tRNA ligase family protein [Bacillota bacterium]|nr:class I tRNA ligase family protein [Bacillota bacterium]
MDYRFYNIKFGLKGSESKEQLLIATTRPELLNGCVSLFVHPEDERYQRIIGKEAIVPLYDYAIPILAESTVAMDKGTGIVMCATFGDSTDVDWVHSHDLPYRRVIEQNGLISDDDPIIGGMHISKARKHIVQVLDEAGYISEEKEIEHFVAVHERCGTHVEIMPSKQWYIDILTDKERFIEVTDDEDLPVNPLESAPKKSCSCGSNDFLPESAVLDTWATSSVTPLINSHWGEKDGSDITSELMPMTMRTPALIEAHSADAIRYWAANALNEYEIGTARHHIDAFFWNDFCDNYLELVKERVYQPEKHGHAEKKSGQTALYRVLLGVLELYAPYIPHITEYLYQTYFVNFESEPSLHLRTWPSNRQVDEVLHKFGEEIKISIAEARRYKSEHSLSMKSPMPLLELRCTEKTEALYDLTLNDLKACTHAEVMAKVIS